MWRVYLVVIVVLTGLLWYQNYSKKRVQVRLNETVIQLEEEKKNKPKEIVITDTKIEYVYRDGKTVTQYRTPDGYVKFDLKKYDKIQSDMLLLERERLSVQEKLNIALRDSLLNKITINKLSGKLFTLSNEIDVLRSKLNPVSQETDFITVQNKGFVFRPQIGVGYNGEFSPYIGVKVAYWGNYGLSVGTTRQQAGITISRRIHDMVPFVRNTEFLIMGGIPYKSGDGNIFVGLGVNL